MFWWSCGWHCLASNKIGRHDFQYETKRTWYQEPIWEIWNRKVSKHWAKVLLLFIFSSQIICTLYYREEIKGLEGEKRNIESTVYTLKQQIEHYRNKVKDRDKLENEIMLLKQKLSDLHNLELVLTGTRDEVSNMVKHNHDPQSLGIMVTTLKKLVWVSLLLSVLTAFLQRITRCWQKKETTSNKAQRVATKSTYTTEKRRWTVIKEF